MKMLNLLKRETDLQKWRGDFPFLQRTVNSKPIIYFDNACMSLRPKAVIEKCNQYYFNYPGCAGRSNHFIAEEVEKEVQAARQKVARFFKAKSAEEVIFTKNTTEAINLVANAFPFQKGDIVLTSDKEHNSNLLPWLQLQKKGLIIHQHLDSTVTNEFSLEALEEKLKQGQGRIRLVSVVHTSNLDGVTNPVKEIASLAHQHHAKILLDCAQSAPHQEVNLKQIGADFLACSAHKMLGPNGVGALISTKKNLEELNQFMVGGETVTDSSLEGTYQMEKIPERFEAGLQNYPGITGFGEALRYLEKVGIKNIERQLLFLNAQVTDGLVNFNGLHLLGPREAEKRSGIFSFVMEKKNIHEVSLLLSKVHHILVRSGAHCVHSWFNQHQNSVFRNGTVRASFGFYNTAEEVDAFVAAVKKIGKL